MNANEKIAEVMGWEILTICRVEHFNDGRKCFPTNSWECVKAMQQRMVDDGWEITINIGKGRGWIEALKFDGDLYHRIGVDHQYRVAGNDEVLTEPAAIVALFCRVYGIEEDK
jgi:hypothetical protein